VSTTTPEGISISVLGRYGHGSALSSKGAEPFAKKSWEPKVSSPPDPQKAHPTTAMVPSSYPVALIDGYSDYDVLIEPKVAPPQLRS